MKTKISKGKNNGKDCYVLTVHYEDQRKRKFFKSFQEANRFDVVAWLGEKKKVEPMGDQTILSIARDKYLLAFQEANNNPEKPRQKGYDTTADRVNKFIRWFGEGRAVSEVTVEAWKKYVTSGRSPNGKPWSKKTRHGYGSAARIFLAWCAREGYGQGKSTWYSATNKDIAIDEKKTFHKLPGICSVEETKALLDTIHPKYKPTMALMFFTGIRAEMEMTMLRHSDIQFGKRICLEAERTKTGRERWIVPPENLWEWMPKRGKGLVNPVSFNAFTQARAWAAKGAFGIGTLVRGKPCRGHGEGFTYPSNGARHSFGSYGYWRNFEWALDAMGHMSSETFLKNYKNNRVDSEDSEEYFSITP